MVSESQQLLASNIAYADLDASFSALVKKGKTPVTLEMAISHALENDANLGSLNNFLENGKLKPEYAYAKDWTITAAVNENTDNGSGLYACILDTGDANILACRGSEEMSEIQNWRQDWYGADFKLLNAESTAQEESLYQFMKRHPELNNKPWVSTGHSLGGALADYAAVRSVELGMDNYSGTYNFDGPGHSREFIRTYKDAIDHVSDKMVHKKASIVGSLMYDIPGAKQDYIQTYDVGLSDKHSMKNWVYDENGNTTPGSRDAAEFFCEKLTRGADRLPSFIGDGSVYLINLAVEGIFWAKKFIDDHPEFVQRLINRACVFFIDNPAAAGATIAVIAAIAVSVITFLAAIIIGEIIYEVLEAIIHAAVDFVCATVQHLAEEAVELYNAAMELINSVYQYIRRNSPGGKYVGTHPQFSADTNLLREYAYRLGSVNSRLAILDRDLDDLYWQVGLLDVFDILRANLIVGYSWRISRCQSYLNTAANTLETADNQALGYLGG